MLIISTLPLPSLVKPNNLEHNARQCRKKNKEKNSGGRVSGFRVGTRRGGDFNGCSFFGGRRRLADLIHEPRLLDKGIRSRLETCLPSRGTVGECLPDTVSSTYSRVIRWNLWSTTTRGWTSSLHVERVQPFHTEFFVNWTNIAPSFSPRRERISSTLRSSLIPSCLRKCLNVDVTCATYRNKSSFVDESTLMKIVETNERGKVVIFATFLLIVIKFV